MADVQVLSGLSCQQFINGQLVDGEGQQECIVNPANGETLIALTEASSAQVGGAVKAA
ncbi:TPA: gamma-aminobutyraldehyde dehydrogenase, partial [Serratia marcescens]